MHVALIFSLPMNCKISLCSGLRRGQYLRITGDIPFLTMSLVLILLKIPTILSWLWILSFFTLCNVWLTGYFMGWLAARQSIPFPLSISCHEIIFY